MALRQATNHTRLPKVPILEMKHFLASVVAEATTTMPSRNVKLPSGLWQLVLLIQQISL